MSETSTGTARPDVVSAEEWQRQRDELMLAEKEATRALDALAARRRRLPMVRFRTDYAFEGPDGTRTLLDLFEGRPQLAVYAGPDPGPQGREGLGPAVLLLAGNHVLSRLRRRRRLRPQPVPARRRRGVPHLLHHLAGRRPADVLQQRPRPGGLRPAAGLGGLPRGLAAAPDLRLSRDTPGRGFS